MPDPKIQDRDAQQGREKRILSPGEREKEGNVNNHTATADHQNRERDACDSLSHAVSRLRVEKDRGTQVKCTASTRTASDGVTASEMGTRALTAVSLVLAGTGCGTTPIWQRRMDMNMLRQTLSFVLHANRVAVRQSNDHQRRPLLYSAFGFVDGGFTK